MGYRSSSSGENGKNLLRFDHKDKLSFQKISHTWSKSHQDRTSVEVVERRRVLLEV